VLNIPQQTIDEIKSRIDIVDVIGDFVNLKKSGQTYKAHSPFTSEKTPSFFVVPAKGIYKCFSSGKGGDAINFIMEYDGLNYLEALKYLAGKYGIEIEERELTDEELKSQNERESLFIILNYAKKYFQKNLYDTEEGKAVGLSYFNDRGIDNLTIEKFGLGYSMESWDGFIKQAIADGFSKEIIEKAGLSVERNDKVYDRFRGRVMFPIYNQTGKVIAFGARTLKKEKKQPKYINSPETEIYHKSSILYGLDLAKGPIRKDDNCFLVEGYTDVISLHKVGIENVVSSSGTALSEEQVKLLTRFSNNITILFDGDPAGLRASLRGVDLILQGGQNVKIVVLPEGEDPDSLSKSLGSYEFQKFLETNAHDFITFKVNLFVNEEKGDPVKKAATVREIVESIGKIPDIIKRAVYIKEASVLLEIDESILITELNKVILKERKRYERDGSRYQDIPIMPEALEELEPKESYLDRNRKALVLKEREEIRTLLRYGSMTIEENVPLHEYLIGELEEVQFLTPVYKEIYDLFIVHAKNGNADIAFFLENGSESAKSEVAELITDKYEISPKWKEKYKIDIPNEEDVLAHKAYTDVLRHKLVKVKIMVQDNLHELQLAKSKEDQENFQRIHVKIKKVEDEIASNLGIIVTR